MTNEEAIKKIKSLCHGCVEFPHCVNTDPDCFKALEMAIKALEQEPCEDCISRQAVLDYIDKMPSELTTDGRRMIRRITLGEYISDTLPSVTPKPKTDVLDKIKAEIEHLTITKGGEDYIRKMAELYSLKIKVLQIIDKYKTERNNKE